MDAIVSLLMTYTGFALMALAMDKHRKKLLLRPSTLAWKPVLLRLGGWACMALALAAPVAEIGPGEGIVLWFGVLSLAALVLVAQLSYLPLSTVYTTAVSFVMGLVGLATIFKIPNGLY